MARPGGEGMDRVRVHADGRYAEGAEESRGTWGSSGALQEGQPQPASLHAPPVAGACSCASCSQQCLVSAVPARETAAEAAPARKTSVSSRIRGLAIFRRALSIRLI